MLRQFWDNLSTLIVAMLLAMLIWVIASFQENPLEDRTLTQPLPVEVINLPTNLVLVSTSVTHTLPSLRAPKLVWDDMDGPPLQVIADLQNLSAGSHAVPLQAILSNGEVRVLKLEPAYLDVTLEPVKSRSIPIILEQTGEPALGYAAEPGTLSSEMVTVTGPASVVDAAVQCVVRISVDNLRRSVESLMPLTPLDENNKALTRLTLDPTAVTATIPIVQEQGFRDVAVKVVITGQVAAGYKVTNYTVSPQFITLASEDPQLISDMPGFVETTPLDISNATDDVAQNLALNLPPGVEAVDGDQVMVQVNIAAIEYSLTLEQKIEATGLGLGLGALISPTTATVRILGPLVQLNELTLENLQVVVNLEGKGPGTYQLTLEVRLPAGLRAEDVVPTLVDVTVILATPTPTAPPPTPTRRP